MVSYFVSWQSSNWLANDVGHSIGAFIGSPGFAGSMAVIAALVAARQVKKTRAESERARRKEEADRHQEAVDRHSDQLWDRFVWLMSNWDELSPQSIVSILNSLHDDAEAHPDSTLRAVISEVRMSSFDNFYTAISAFLKPPPGKADHDETD